MNFYRLEPHCLIGQQGLEERRALRLQLKDTGAALSDILDTVIDRPFEASDPDIELIKLK
jgi:hypothetical protein